MQTLSSIIQQTERGRVKEFTCFENIIEFYFVAIVGLKHKVRFCKMIHILFISHILRAGVTMRSGRVKKEKS